MMDHIKVFCDGGARGNPGPAAAAFAVEVDGKFVKKESVFIGNSTNNEAEYRAVILALSWLSTNKDYNLSTKKILFILDSQLVANQLKGTYKVKSSNLKPLFNNAFQLMKHIVSDLEIVSVPRNKNKTADALVNAALDSKLSNEK